MLGGKIKINQRWLKTFAQYCTSSPESEAVARGHTVAHSLDRKGLRRIESHSSPHICPHHLFASLQPTPPTLLRACLHWVCTHTHSHGMAYKRRSLYSRVSKELTQNGQNRRQQRIKHLSKAAIPYNTALTVRADIQRKWLKACENDHVSVSTFWWTLTFTNSQYCTIWISQIKNKKSISLFIAVSCSNDACVAEWQ